jgi:hypothetical protein
MRRAVLVASHEARWRDRRNELAAILEMDKATDIAEGILKELGADRARTVVRALHKRLRTIKPDCKACHGTGIMEVTLIPGGGRAFKVADAQDAVRMTSPCDCGPQAARFVAPPQEFSWAVIATTKDGKRWQNGVRFHTHEQAEQYCEVHVQQNYGPKGREGYVTTTSIIRSDDRPRNSIFRHRGRPTLGFTDGECHHLSWHEVGTPAPAECEMALGATGGH